MTNLHMPVLLEEVLSYFKGVIHTFFDGTVGAGGHAGALLADHPEMERYVACDADRNSIGIARSALSSFGEKISFVEGNFCDLDRYLAERNISTVNGCLFDLGVSSMQIDQAHRGFSFQKEGPLDMRMDPRESLTAEEIVNGWSQKDLEQLFWNGEEKRAKKVAAAIVEERKHQPIQSTSHLSRLIEKVLGRFGKIHPATLVFQALRMAVNRELASIQQGIRKALERLAPNGRLAVISFHSLEDRIVKQIFHEASQPLRNEKGAILQAPLFCRLTKKVVTPSLQELRKNPRSRSAKLRVLQRLGL